MQSMNGVLDAEPDPQAAFNLVLCTYALGDKEMMKQAFAKLVEVSKTSLAWWGFDGMKLSCSPMFLHCASTVARHARAR